MRRRGWFPRGAGVCSSLLALFTASSCYRAEIDLSALMDDMMQGGTSSSTAGSSGSTSGSDAVAGDAPGNGGSAGGAGDVGAAGDFSVAGQGGASEPPCIDEPLAPEQKVCAVLGRPTLEECSDQDPDGWAGCRFGNCYVCKEALLEFHYYFDWHPCCKVNSTCGSLADDAIACSARCPEPNERDKSPRCGQVSLEQ